MRAPLASPALARHDRFAFEMKKPGKRANAGRAGNFTGDPMMNPSHVGVKVGVRTKHMLPPQNRLPFQFRPDPVALDQLRLPRTARALFVAILDDAKSKGWKSRRCNATLARILGCSTMTVKRGLARLESLGLIRRDYTADGRTRLGIHVTWEGVEHSRAAEQASVEQPCSTGGTPAFRGVEHSRSTSSESGVQSEREQTGPISLSTEEDEEQAALFEQLGPAEYLRMMVRKGREQMDTLKPATPPPAPSSPARPSENALRFTLGSMVGQLGAALSLNELRPPRRRR